VCGLVGINDGSGRACSIRRANTLLNMNNVRNYIQNLCAYADFGWGVGIADGVEQLSKLEIDDLEMSRAPLEEIRKHVQDFRATYTSILSLVALKGEITPSVAPTSTQLNKRPSEFTDNTSSKRSKTSPPRTPDQQTVLPNPNYSNDSNLSGLSGISTESADEEYTKAFIKAFVQDSLMCLMSDFSTLSWTKSPVPTRLDIGSVSPLRFVFSLYVSNSD
jgi:hypothetical protein